MSASEVPPPQFYSQEDVQQILHLAIARRTEGGELSREQLWEIAAELEIEPQDIQAAEQDWLTHKKFDQKRQEFDRYRRERLKQKLIKYLIVNAFLVVLDLLTAGMLSWSKWVLILWGLGLTLETWRTFQSRGEAYEQAFQHWNFKNEMKQSMASLWGKIKQFLQA